VYPEGSDVAVPLQESQLPLELPETDNFKPSGRCVAADPVAGWFPSGSCYANPPPPILQVAGSGCFKLTSSPLEH